MKLATKEVLFPETMISPETDKTLKRDTRPFEVSYKGEKIVVYLPGYYPAGNGEGVHVGKDMSVVDDALRELKLR
jgi:HTH-type transcriptional regulator / antitoxin MqsA